jgi:hypothetical protein
MSLEILGALAPRPFLTLPPGRKYPDYGNWQRRGISLAELNKRLSNRPDLNVGLLLGPASGVIDIDCDGPQAEASLLRLFDGPPPATLSFASRRGRHLLLRYDERFAGLKAAFKPAEYADLEIRVGGGKGAQTVIPPSVVDGIQRMWLTECEVAAWR